MSIMEEERDVPNPSKQRSSRSWKRVVSQATQSERMKKTSDSGRNSNEPRQESRRRSGEKAPESGERQEGET